MSNLDMTKITLIGEWITYPSGSTITVPNYKAEEMVQRGVAEYFVEKNSENIIKAIDEPPMHKMVTEAPVKKAGRPKKIK